MQRTTLVTVAALVAAVATLWSAQPASAAAYLIRTLDAAGSPGVHTSLVLDAAGNPAVAYQDSLANDLRILRCDDPLCSDGGETIEAPATGGNTGQYPSVRLDAAGNPVIAFYDATSRRLTILRCDDPACAPGGDTLNTPDTTAGVNTGVGRFPSLQLDAAGNPIVSYHDDVTGDLKILRCDDPACALGGDTINVPDSDGDVGWYTSLQLDAAGNPVVSYSNQTAGDLKILHCDDPACAPGGDTITSPDTEGNTGKSTSLRLDSVGSPVVSYFDSGNERLRLLHCDDPACAPGGDTIESPDPSTGVGAYGSLAIDSEGNPVISYYDHVRFKLRVVRCTDPACAGGDERIDTPEPTGAVGEWTSLALDAEDNPVVTYRSQSEQALKLAYAGGAYPIPACAIGWWTGSDTLSAALGPELTGSVGFAPAVAGNGFAFDGSGILSGDALPLVSTGVSVELWVRPVQTGTVQALISRWDFPGVGPNRKAAAFALRLDHLGNIVWLTDDTSPRYPVRLQAPVPQLYDGNFHHVAATWDSTRMIVYVDGAEIASQRSQGGSLNAAPDTPVVVGGAATPTTPFPFTGVIDEPAVYSCALPLEDIEGIYLAGPDGKA